VAPKRKKGPQAERRYQRASCDFPAEFAWGAVTHPARVMVIGIGGCFLFTHALAPPGEEVDLSFEMDSEEEKISCRGVVAWVADEGIDARGLKKLDGFAVEFLRIFPEDRERIDEYVRTQVRLFKAMDHELKKKEPDRALVKELFARARPFESTHLNHIRKTVKDEMRYFRLRK